MAQIIVFEKEMKNKFYNWVSQYLGAEGGNIKVYPVEELIAFLVSEHVFTLESLRSELNKSHISLHEKYFEKAKKLLQKETGKPS